MSERKMRGQERLASVLGKTTSAEHLEAAVRAASEAAEAFMKGEREAQSSGELVVDFPREATPEDLAKFWRRVEEAGCLISVDPGVAQYASVTVILPPRFVGKVPPLVVFDDGEGKGDE